MAKNSISINLKLSRLPILLLLQEENPEPWLDNFTPTELAMYAAGQVADWMKLATQTGIKRQHNLSFRGGANKTSYFISLNYTDVKGTAVGNEFKRYNIRFKS